MQSGGVERKTTPNLHGIELERWLQQSHSSPTTLSNNERGQGGLRLLVHRWSSEELDIKTFEDAPLPFESKKSLDMVLDEFRLPKDYPLDLYRRQDIPLRLTITGGKGKQRLGTLTSNMAPQPILT